MKFLYTYVFRGLGLVMLLAMMTILCLACNQRVNRTQEERARDEAKRMLETMTKDADAEIRKYTSGQTQKPPAKKDEQKEKSK